VQSLSTAVLVQAVSKACSAGLSSHCSCGPVPNDAPSDHQMENFQWGGCPDDLPYGLAFSRVFERTRPSSSKRRKVSRRALINQHNSDVGRQVRLSNPSIHPFLARDGIYAIARYMPSPVRPSVRLYVRHTGGLVKDG